LTKNRGASKYVFEDIIFHMDQSDSAMRRKGNQVMRLDMATFLGGMGTVQNGGNIAYVLAFPDLPPLPLLNVPARPAAVGLDRDHGFDITNVNTLIIKPDCKTVVTSFPGLPSRFNFPGGHFNISGTPQWYPRTDPRNPGW
jgi:hypothetical protein